MAKYRAIQVGFWDDAKVIEEMTPEDKFFMVYLLTNPNTTQIGVYKITKKQMAFHLGYSIETINSLLERFENRHQLIKYNPETREIVFRNWGKHNFVKSGKPMYDLIRKELKEIEDKSLLSWMFEAYLESVDIPNVEISKIIKDFLGQSSSPTNRTTIRATVRTTIGGTTGGQKRKIKKKKEKEKEIIKHIVAPENENEQLRVEISNEIPSEESTEPLNQDDTDAYKLSVYLYEQILKNDCNAKKPNLSEWSKHIDKLIRLDNRDPVTIRAVIEYCQNDEFWKSNILSTKKLREKFQALYIRMQSEKTKGIYKSASSGKGPIKIAAVRG